MRRKLAIAALLVTLATAGTVSAIILTDGGSDPTTPTDTGEPMSSLMSILSEGDIPEGTHTFPTTTR